MGAKCASCLFVDVCDICTGNVNVSKFIGCFCAVVKQVANRLYNQNVGDSKAVEFI